MAKPITIDAGLTFQDSAMPPDLTTFVIGGGDAPSPLLASYRGAVRRVDVAVARAGVIRDAGGFSASADHDSVQALGARVGLTSLRRHRRNVAARGVVCAQALRPLSIDAGVDVDPYV